MKTVHKYDIPLDGHTTIVSMPEGAQILYVACQKDEATVQIWALVDLGGKHEMRSFVTVGTGQPAPPWLTSADYHGTVLLRQGTLVLHIFSYLRGG